MTNKVNPEGALIPRELLGGAEEIEVLGRNGNRLIIQVGPEPRRDEGADGRRSIFKLLGSDPIDDGPADASRNTDLYLDRRCRDIQAYGARTPRVMR